MALSDSLRDGRMAVTERFPAVAGIVAAVVVAATLGLLSARIGTWSIAVAIGILCVGIAAIDLALLPVVAMPLSLLSVRAGGVLSFSDVALAGATVVALFLLRRRGAMALQPLLWAGVGYLVAVIPDLVLNRYSANYVEWAHEVVLVLGSMVVGFVIGREGKAGSAFGLYTLACAVIGVIAGIAALRGFASSGAFTPVSLNALNKNAIGGSLAAALVIAFARPAWLHWRPWFSNLMVVCCALGVLASQSRQGMIGAVAGVIVVALRPVARRGGRARLVFLVAIPVLYLVYQQVTTQLNSADQFNSASQRLTWYAQTIEIWKTSPIFGVGLRWWYTARFGAAFQPPNAELEVLSCVGVVGLIAFLIMFAAGARALQRIPVEYGTVGMAVIATRFVQAQFDLYWVSGQSSFLWIVAGACVGVYVRERLRVDAADTALRVPSGTAVRRMLRAPRREAWR
ncbi:O-antigen ligase family protein [Gryllotalpicola reticulitermitis]|uniref:O-antigen ligase family protein n=1 Tax=Gryllotalpicola reticulitermitis TaxID=1184153 RepID=A0ABV8Q5K6_9MICO